MSELLGHSSVQITLDRYVHQQWTQKGLYGEINLDLIVVKDNGRYRKIAVFLRDYRSNHKVFSFMVASFILSLCGGNGFEVLKIGGSLNGRTGGNC